MRDDVKKAFRKAINPFTLRIRDPKRERDYQKTTISDSIVHYRVALASGILFYILFGYVDPYLYPTVHSEFNLIRVAFVTPCLGLILLASFTDIYKRFARTFNVLAVAVSSAGIIFMAYIGHGEPEISRIYTGLIIIFFYLYAFMNISYLEGFVVGNLIIITYLFVAWHIDQVPKAIFMNSAFSLMASNFAGTIVAYIIEHHSKSEYLLKEQLAESVLLDPLTGLYNRHYFEQVVVRNIDEFIGRADGLETIERRHGQLKMAKYGIFMIDIDHFKKINDTFGHHSGDLVLKQFAQLLKENLRSSDDVIRFGGEEFLLVVRYTSYDSLIKLVKKLGDMIENYDFNIEGSRVIGCTVSIGMVVVPEREAHDVQELIKFADRALYRSKETGRNKGHRAYVGKGTMCYEEISWQI